MNTTISNILIFKTEKPATRTVLTKFYMFSNSKHNIHLTYIVLQEYEQNLNSLKTVPFH